LAVGPQALNNEGQIVFWYKVGMGSDPDKHFQGIALATPVPEPATPGLLLAGCAMSLAWLVMRRQRR
jgi:hypothetical protein